MSSALQRICADKREHVASRKLQGGTSAIGERARHASPVRGFHAALKSRADRNEFGIVAEFKKGSPSKGRICVDADPGLVASAYERGGAACISVLTDEPHFLGCDDDLVAAREAVSLPVLRKDFMVDPWQVAESRMLGADCVLVIMAALEDALAAEIEAAALEWGMDVLLEVHNQEEFERAMRLRSPLLGINNRNLKTLKTDVTTTIELAPIAAASGRLVIAESGLESPRDLAKAWEAGARGFLIGESLMRKPDAEAAVRSLLTNSCAAVKEADL